LLSMARVSGDPELADFVLARLTPEALAKERAVLSEPPNSGFELPYGQSWLLLLFREMALHSLADSARIREFRLEVESRILNWLETATFPDGSMTGQAFQGAHQSWLFAFLLMELSKPITSGAHERLASLYIHKIEPLRSAIMANPVVAGDFLYLPAILALIDRTLPGANVIAYLVEPATPFQSPVTGANAHSPGLAMIRIWPYADEAFHGDLAACGRFNTRLSEMFARTEQWSDAFDTVSHWVPQFMWMAIWLGMGRP
jgi:hypothetical protein